MKIHGETKCSFNVNGTLYARVVRTSADRESAIERASRKSRYTRNRVALLNEFSARKLARFSAWNSPLIIFFFSNAERKDASVRFVARFFLFFFPFEKPDTTLRTSRSSDDAVKSLGIENDVEVFLLRRGSDRGAIQFTFHRERCKLVPFV